MKAAFVCSPRKTFSGFSSSGGAPQLGFSLPEIRELFFLQKEREACCHVRDLLQAKLEAVRNKIRELATIEEQLAKNHHPAVDRLRTVLRREGLPAEIFEIQVKDESSAKALKFCGSPTIRIDGIDIDPEARSVGETGFACRLYSGGLPSEEMIPVALGEAREK